MTFFSRTGRRWAVPVAALTAVLGVGAVANYAPAGADTPNLPPLTPAELLAKVRTAQVASLSGTVSLTANLGLPSTSALSSSLGGSSTMTLATLLAGTHSADVAVDGPDHVRVTTVKPLAETNWVRNGNDVWSYDSTTLRATHLTLPADTRTGTHAGGKDATAPGSPEPTPAQFAQQLLDQVTPSTGVRVDTPSYIDSRPVYELVLSPKTAASTVQDAVISVDGASGVPLAVRIDAKSGSNPAFSFGFTRVSFAKPAASMFVFTPPPGSTVVQASSPAQLLNPTPGGQRGLRRHGRFAGPGPKGRMLVPRGVAPADLMPVPQTPSNQANQTDRVATIGQDWSTVAVLSGGALPPQAMALFNGAPAITVGSHQGRVVTTKLLTAILLDDGRVAIGALTPDALAAAVAAG